MLMLLKSESLRAVPMIREKYQIDYSKQHITRRLREEWERNRGMKDPAMVDLLVFKGWAELDEAKFLWKQRPHMMAFLAPKDSTQHKAAPSKNDFLKRFFAGQEIDY